MRKISIVNLIDEVVKRHREKADAKNVILHVDIANDGLFFEGDANKIEIVIDNLLKNAITFTPTGGHVFVTAEQIPGYIKVSVIDDGIGIPPEDIERIFERFYQVQSHLTRQHGGMGLGLSVAKVMVEMHGGEIWAESILEKGSRFSFRLPINAEQVDAAKSVFDL